MREDQLNAGFAVDAAFMLIFECSASPKTWMGRAHIIESCARRKNLLEGAVCRLAKMSCARA